MHGITLVLIVANLALFSSHVSATFHDGDIVPASRRGQFHGVSAATCLPYRAQQTKSCSADFHQSTNIIPACSPEPRGMTFWEDTARDSQWRARSKPPSCVQLSCVPFETCDVTVVITLTKSDCPHAQVAIPIPQPKGSKAIDRTYKIQFVFDGEVFTLDLKVRRPVCRLPDSAQLWPMPGPPLASYAGMSCLEATLRSIALPAIPRILVQGIVCIAPGYRSSGRNRQRLQSC